MNDPSLRAHWENVYSSKGEKDVSWFQDSADTSLDLLSAEHVAETSAIIDVGGGLSRLVDGLLDRGQTNVTVLDISAAALDGARRRLGPRAASVNWIEADITRWTPGERYDVWHDRAVLHFLTEESEQVAYLRALNAALRPGGLVVIGTFDLDGPDKCSGLPVQRYSPASLAQLLGENYELIDSRAEDHETPWRTRQRFQFSRFLRRADA